MSSVQNQINEQCAAEAFTKQSVIFDELYARNTIIQYKRERVREHVLRYLKPRSAILELNSGTGEDAIFFAKQGHQVHATDLSAGMQDVLQKKVNYNNLNDSISFEQCSYTSLAFLKDKGPYDLVFSNFAGLNCTNELDLVLKSFSSLLKPGGMVTLVILPKVCLWEFLLVFKGKFKIAIRRILRANKQNAHLEGTLFTCWYYNPAFVIRHMKDDYDLVNIEGLCTLVPPSYLENFAEKYPKIYRFLRAKEDLLKSRWPWRSIGDYYIISLRKK